MLNQTSFLMLATLLGAGSLCRADILTTARTIDYNITFSDNAMFTDASANVVNTYTVAPGSSGTDTETGGYATLNTGISFFATGGVSINPLSAPPLTGEVTTTINVTGAGTYGFRESAPVFNGRLSSVSYFPSSLARFDYNGFYTLEIFSPSNAFLDAGGIWVTSISLPGDWSKGGNADASGTHLLYDLDPLWTITSNFVYDPIDNRTLFTVENSNYPGPDSYDNGPYPVILLTGSQVPEPGSVGLFGCGGLLLTIVLRKKRKLCGRGIVSLFETDSRNRTRRCFGRDSHFIVGAAGAAHAVRNSSEEDLFQ